jgi:hypothetical protein
MTDPTNDTTKRRMLREIAGIILIVLGVAGLNEAAWLIDPIAGIAASSVTAIAVGVLLGLDR